MWACAAQRRISVRSWRIKSPPCHARRWIDEQGARLSKSPTYEELRSYRALIQSFIGEAVDGMYELHTQAGWDRLGRQKVYTSVRKIDKKLEEMAEKIRLGQADQLSIIASHDAIRGLLVDLYM